MLVQYFLARPIWTNLPWERRGRTPRLARLLIPTTTCVWPAVLRPVRPWQWRQDLPFLRLVLIPVVLYALRLRGAAWLALNRLTAWFLAMACFLLVQVWG